MVKIKLPDPEKPAEVQNGDILPGDLPLLPTTVIVKRKNQETSKNRSCIALVLLSIVFATFTIKTICDLKEENLMLMKELAFEKQKDSVLQLAVRNNIPSSKFLGHQFTAKETAIVEKNGRKWLQPKTSSWTINLSVLWSSPDISTCDMHKLSHVLAEEIYRTLPANEEDVPNEPWTQEIKEEISAMIGNLENAKESQESKESSGKVSLEEVWGSSKELKESPDESTDDSNESFEEAGEMEDIEEVNVYDEELLYPENHLDGPPAFLTPEEIDYLAELDHKAYMQNIEGEYDSLPIQSEYEGASDYPEYLY